MTPLCNPLRTAVGKKAVMAVSGVLLFGFVLGHMAGNLKLYMGPDAINAYAHHLRTLGEPVFPPTSLLWVARLALLGAVGAHAWAAWATTRQSLEARGVRYAVTSPQVTTYAARTMRWGGVIIFLFVCFHLADLTFGVGHPQFSHATPEAHADVYANVVASFSRWPVAVVYMLANVALGFHLYHGLWSFFQSLGLNNPKFNAARRTFATVFACLVTAGNVSFPLSVLLGWVK